MGGSLGRHRSGEAAMVIAAVGRQGKSQAVTSRTIIRKMARKRTFTFNAFALRAIRWA